MELPDLGKRCANEKCKQLDFLPFQCSHCKLIFCKDHYMPENHECLTNLNSPSIVQPVKYYYCSYNDCKSVSPVEMCCPACVKHYCLQHRHHGCIDKDQETRNKEKEKWEAPKKQFEVAKAEADRQVVAALARAKKKDSRNKTALKVQLMRLKAKALGLKGVPTTDRVYFLVYPPLNMSKNSQPIFVAKQWTIGKIIDCFADIIDIPNKNNETGAKKLRIYHQENGKLLCTEMEKKLQDFLVEGSIVDGETLILEYSTDDELSCEIDVEQYKD
ncbi:AN1-type zinc finger protein 1 [Blattella germanica]|nr:AN1-type zinc finger protein 1 [Blattella germanica]